MEHESFENEDVARLLVRPRLCRFRLAPLHQLRLASFADRASSQLLFAQSASFVSIKVDREERPDVDKVYMAYLQATQGGGGWPLNLFLTPSLHPFLAGTYFPLDDKYGRKGFKSLLATVAGVWASRRGDVEASAADGIAQLQEALDAEPEAAAGSGGGKSRSGAALALVVDALAKRFDPIHGGFGAAPKVRPHRGSVISPTSLFARFSSPIPSSPSPLHSASSPHPLSTFTRPVPPPGGACGPSRGRLATRAPHDRVHAARAHRRRRARPRRRARALPSRLCTSSFFKHFS